ncbi:ABC transporter substrate-binding protein [Cohnella cholangitidis]|uniref:Extracellular solute-binding protein n=1 Tax=Cohnella cholangitidis TaxID=2598458 RepID=A0A7G5C044_9BACL|nr:extracellular solute-binding protein [Cohnella cholangitidis]QMV42578.1 extracellular solute-binding protein [Cohnella cholangitidis]
MRRLVSIATIFAIVPLSLASCSSDKPEESVTLKIAGVYQETFLQSIGYEYMQRHPNVEFEFLPEIPYTDDAGNDIERLFSEEQPDIFVTGANYYAEAVKTGRLASIDPYLRKSKSPGIVPFIDRHLRTYAKDGSLYGYPTAFESSALLYNKTLFDEYHIDYPVNNMTWDNVLKIAGAFPRTDKRDKPILGLLTGTGGDDVGAYLFYRVDDAGMSNNLAIVNPGKNKATVDSQSWLETWKLFLEAYHNGTLGPTALEVSEANEWIDGVAFDDKFRPFLAGNAAMAFADTSLLPYLIGSKKSTGVNWGMVSPPGQYQIHLQIPSIYTINAGSAKKNAAWQLLEFIAGNESTIHQAEHDNRTFGVELKANIKPIEDIFDVDLSPFYISEAANRGIYSSGNDNYLRAYYTNGPLEMNKVLDGDQTIEEALGSLQAAVDAALKSDGSQ